MGLFDNLFKKIKQDFKEADEEIKETVEQINKLKSKIDEVFVLIRKIKEQDDDNFSNKDEIGNILTDLENKLEELSELESSSNDNAISEINKFLKGQGAEWFKDLYTFKYFMGVFIKQKRQEHK